jgi:enoyl-[acyl-carrier-protein] reductase (NADH)
LLDFEKIARRNGTTVDEAMAVARSENAQHRVLEADELAGMATLLASDDGAGITGQVVSVDGGYRL